MSEFKLHVDTSATVIYIDPPDSTVAKGDTFKTKVTISNPTAKSFNEVRLAIRYDRDTLKPVLYHDKALKPLLAGKSRVEIDPQLGILLYSAQLKSPLNSVTDPLFEVKWEALHLSNRAELTFVTYKEKSSGLWMGANDILANPENPSDGFINGSAQVMAPDVFAAFQKKGGRRSSGEIDEVSLMPMPPSIGGVHLKLVGPGRPVEVGKTFKVDIVLDNTADSFVDRVDVYLRYDPETLEVLDTDTDNWMTRGTNILDGPYHATFPFDYHIENQVFQGRGEIVYRMGMTDPERLRHRVGTVATVTFRAKTPTPSTSISFRMPDRSFEPGTKLRYLDASVLGDAAADTPGVRGVNLRVVN